MLDYYRGWVESVDKQRIGLRRLLKDSPSLKSKRRGSLKHLYLNGMHFFPSLLFLKILSLFTRKYGIIC